MITAIQKLLQHLYSFEKLNNRTQPGSVGSGISVKRVTEKLCFGHSERYAECRVVRWNRLHQSSRSGSNYGLRQPQRHARLSVESEIARSFWNLPKSMLILCSVSLNKLSSFYFNIEITKKSKAAPNLHCCVIENSAIIFLLLYNHNYLGYQ